MKETTFHSPGYCIDTLEVSALSFQECIVAQGCHPRPFVTGDPYQGSCPEYKRGASDALAATCLSYDDLAEYCSYRGGRVPTELEWEAAARGTDGRRFPWGEDESPLTVVLGHLQGHEVDLPFRGSTPDWSPLGVGDMLGGVDEWTSTETPPFRPETLDRPSTREWLVVRGLWSGARPEHSDSEDFRPLSKRSWGFPADQRRRWLAGRCVHTAE